MKRLMTICAVLLLCSISSASVTVDVTASSAPNAYGGAAWNGYASNALYALENGLSAYGDRATDPTGYEAAPDEVDPWEIAVTSFTSWRGDVNPTGAFANEYGNRMHFGLHAYGDGTTQFTLENLTFEFHSSDADDTLGFVGDFLGYTYNGTTRYGIDWGADRQKGGDDDIIYLSGNGTTLVDELVYVGVGNAWWPGGGPVADPQAAMDEYFDWITGIQPVDVTCTYNIGAYSGVDTVTIVPEPATLALLCMGGLSLLRKRK